jgi:hypothetical protein
MTFGPDGALYVSNVGFGPPPNGLGQVLKITVPQPRIQTVAAGSTAAATSVSSNSDVAIALSKRRGLLLTVNRSSSRVHFC